jgi:hypothetical protein
MVAMTPEFRDTPVLAIRYVPRPFHLVSSVKCVDVCSHLGQFIKPPCWRSFRYHQCTVRMVIQKHILTTAALLPTEGKPLLHLSNCTSQGVNGQSRTMYRLMHPVSLLHKYFVQHSPATLRGSLGISLPINCLI